MKKQRKWCALSVLVSGILMLAVPAGVQAAGRIPVIEENGILPAGDQDQRKDFGTLTEAAKTLRKAMLERKGEITLRVKSASSDTAALFNQLYYDMVLQDSPELPQGGDYLKQNIREYGLTGSSLKYEDDANYYHTITVEIHYNSTAQEEKEVDKAVKSIAGTLKLSTKADDEKIKAVYDYVTSHVTYDEASVEKDDPRAHTAWSAIKLGKAVCQGYTNLVYRLMREADVPVRIVSGTALQNGVETPHSWNIVEINGRWYNLDATWDSTLSGGNDQKYQYFLKSAAEFPGHVCDKEFNTPEFKAKHPLSANSYAKYQPVVQKVTGLKVTPSTTSVKLTWKKLSGVSQYRVLQATSADGLRYKVAAVVKTNSATVKKLKAGTSYQFMVSVYDPKTGDDITYSDPVKVVTIPATVSLSSVKTASKSITASWKKVSPCTGYQLQYSTSSKFTSSTTKTVSLSSKTVSRKITSLKKGKKYYVRVRSYVTVDKKKTYGSWSKAKSITCK